MGASYDELLLQIQYPDPGQKAHAQLLCIEWRGKKITGTRLECLDQILLLASSCKQKGIYIGVIDSPAQFSTDAQTVHAWPSPNPE